MTGLIASEMELGFGAFLGGIVAVVLWLTATVFIWRETPAERRQRLRARSPDVIVCPACGYNLTGLRQTTCPECGAGYTIDELAAMQPGREADDLGGMGQRS